MRRIHVVGLLILLAVLVALFLLPERDRSRTDLAETDERATRPDPTLLTAEGERSEEGRSDDETAPLLRTREAPVASAPPTDRGPVTVQVVGPGGTPLPGVAVGILPMSEHLGRFGHAPPPEDGRVADTDAEGEVVFPGVPYDGSVCAVPYRVDPAGGAQIVSLLPPAGGHPPYAVIRSERVTLRTGVGRWLDVIVVDAQTGRLVRSAKVAVGTPAVRRVDGRGRSLVATNGEKPTHLRLQVTAPRGRVAWEDSTWWFQVSPYAHQLEARYPLREEVPLSVSVSDPDGSPTNRPVIRQIYAAGRRLPKDACTGDAYGRFHVAGVPFLPGELIRVAAGREQGAAAGTASAWIGGSPEVDPKLAVVIPLHLAVTVPPEPDHAIGMGGGAGGRFGGRGGTRSLSPYGGGHPKPKGSVLVTVGRHDGTPAVGALVELRHRDVRTDKRGRAYFPEVWPGTYEVRVKQVGLQPLAGKVTVKGDEQARLELRERKPGRVEVQVVNEHGHPLSYARLEVKTGSGHPWVDVTDGVQRVDPFSDHEGFRVLNGVEPGVVNVRATWGSRSSSITLTVTAGGKHPIRIVLSGPTGN